MEGNMPVACYPEIGRLNTGLFLRPAWEDSKMGGWKLPDKTALLDGSAVVFQRM